MFQQGQYRKRRGSKQCNRRGRYCEGGHTVVFGFRRIKGEDRELEGKEDEVQRLIKRFSTMQYSNNVDIWSRKTGCGPDVCDLQLWPTSRVASRQVWAGEQHNN